MRISVTARCELDEGLLDYAEARLGRLGRHATQLQEVRLVLDQDARRVPAYSAEAVAHLHRTRIASSVDAPTVREAVDRIVDKIDRQVVRLKERIKEHKGHAAAGSPPTAPGPRRTLERRAAGGGPPLP